MGEGRGMKEGVKGRGPGMGGGKQTYCRSANVTLKCNAVTSYRLCHESRAITFIGDNCSNFDRAITLGCDNGSNELETITFRSAQKFSPPC